MDTSAIIEVQMRRINETPRETATALAGAVALLAGWYQSLKLGSDDLRAWAFLVRGLDASLFIPAAMAWAAEHPDWAPTAPQFRQMVERLAAEQRREELLEANARLLEASKAEQYSGLE
ncbi:MAG: hypothetical protein M0027_02395 [Candidatus Dormibacteraeota bacterium]|nr:hypothetical protein [Candidatus Dormibacteraeota bacterium]